MSCPKCGGTFSGPVYHSKRYDEWRNGKYWSEGLCFTCGKCGYSEYRDTNDQKKPMKQRLIEAMQEPEGGKDE